MLGIAYRSTIVVDERGRLVLPYEVRKQLDIKDREQLVLTVEDGKIKIEKL